MTMYHYDGSSLTQVSDTDIVKVSGMSLSAAAAARRFSPAVLSQAGLYQPYYEQDQGDGHDAPRIGTTPTGSPCAYFAAIVRTAADVADEGERLIVARAQVLQEEAAGDYAWPEASAWAPLADQSEDWLRRTSIVGEALAAAAGVGILLDGDERVVVGMLAQEVLDLAAEEASANAAQGLAAPEYTPIQQEAATWLTTAHQIGPDLAADCGPDADVAEIYARAQSVVTKARPFRATVGAIKRWRRRALASIDAALLADGSRPEIESIIERAMAEAASVATFQAGG